MKIHVGKFFAHYKCISCGYEWKEKPKPVVCPKCKHKYVEWVNYYDIDWLKQKRIKENKNG